MAPVYRSWLHELSPDRALLLATGGLCLMVWELNRPGRVLPGAAGLLAFLLAASSLAQHPLRLSALGLCGFAMSVLLANVWLRLPIWLLVTATILLSMAMVFLVPRSAVAAVGLPTALVCGTMLGGGGAALSRIAFRARRAKQVN